MKQYKIWNNALGWFTFLVAALTYCLTVEPTASFWDCPEFILSGNKLEVGHPPGAPFFMLTANFFSMFASPENVAYMVNIMSALLSAGGILFLFWSITHLTRKLIVGRNQGVTKSQMITIFSSGLVGALAYTWSDTYWFSAVEGEVYGYSSLFTAVVFWLILKWEDNANDPRSDRWLILIAYLVGLSIGVHLLNLLCIPAIVLVVYYKKFPNASFWGSVLALVVSAVIVMIVLYGIVPGVVKVGGWFELLFVNIFGLPYNTGLYVYIILLFATIIGGIYLTEKSNNQKLIAGVFTLAVALLGIPFYGHSTSTSILFGLVVLGAIYWACTVGKTTYSKAVATVKYKVSKRFFNTTFLSLLLIMIGYSSYTLIVIRSAANTPMDQNSPEDIFTLGSYLNREQYGTRPLFYGECFDSEVERNKNGEAVFDETSPIYVRAEKKSPKDPDRYVLTGYNKEYRYVQNMLFPRMYSKDHTQFYEMWTGPIENTVKSAYGNRKIKMPTQWNNLTFFVNYQVNHMYWRYFLWNFVGRQNDIQNRFGGKEYGNWISGIPFVDKWHVGDQNALPTSLKENKGHNVFFALPLILGIIGIIWQLVNGRKGKQQFSIVMLLFFMTGLAIVLYLNQTPMQPRERDYAYAGSFYAFAIWIGMGVAGIVQCANKLLKKYNKQEHIVLANSIIAVICLCVPLQMVSQTWDDHDRSGRYACRDFGQNYLNTLPEEGAPIIFTCGDNDTFPLWYCQEVEGERTDARVCNLSYLQTDWYIDQMKRPAYDSPALPITLERDDYCSNTNMATYTIPESGTKIIEAYLKQNPAKAEIVGDIHNVNNITRYWIAEANDRNKSRARRVVEEIIKDVTPKFYDECERLAYESEKIKKIDKKKAQEYASEAELLYWIAEELNNKKPADVAIIPTEELRIPIDSAAVVESGMMIPQKYQKDMPEFMTINIRGKRILYRHELIIFDLLANTNWKRPIYMSTTVGEENYPKVLTKFFVHEGLAYRITPFDWSKEQGYNTESSMNRPVDIDKFYTNVMERFKWGGMKENKDYYADETIRRMIHTHRRYITLLGIKMVREERPHKDIINLLEKLYEEFPSHVAPYDALADNTIAIANLYYAIYNEQKHIKEIEEEKNKRKESLHKLTDNQSQGYNENAELTDTVSLQKERLAKEILQLESILNKNPYLGDDTLKLLKDRITEISNAILKEEYGHLGFYCAMDPKKTKTHDLIESYVHERFSLIEEALSMLVAVEAEPSVPIKDLNDMIGKLERLEQMLE